MTKYRVTKNSATVPGKRMVADRVFNDKESAQEFVRTTNAYFPGAYARVVRDSERVRKLERKR